MFFDAKPYDRESFNRANERYGFQLKYINNRLTKDTVSLAAGYDAVCAFVNDEISADVLQSLHQNGIRLIAMRSAGYNNVDLETAYERIHVVRVPAYSPYAVAEHAAAMILSLNRKIYRSFIRTRDSNFSLNGLLGFDLNGKTAGVIGTGRIGQILVKILQGFGMRVLVYDVFPNKEWAANAGADYVSLDELYRESDIISLHCPLTKETKHLINAESLGKMKQGVMLINTSRGGLIKTKDLINALKSQKIGCAGLDVYEEEDQYFFEDHSSEILTDDVLARLLTFPNVLVTAHQAFFTREALENIAETTLHNIRDYFDNKPLLNEICYRCEKPECLHKKTGRCF